MIKGVLEILGWIGIRLEHALVLILEGMTRLLLRLDPRVYDETARVEGIEEGARSHGSNKCAVLVLFCDEPLPDFTTSAVDAFNRRGYEVIVVANKNLHPMARAYLLANCRLLIHRKNIGRDFGGYKDAISIVSRRFPDLQRLLISNDSIFYFRPGLDDLIAQLDGPQDFIGASEVFPHHYHVGSYLISFGPAVLRSKPFRDFWDSYKPISTRRWAILRGEGGLTAVLVNAGFKPQIVFPAEDLRRALSASSAEELRRLIELLPQGSRARCQALLAEALARSQAKAASCQLSAGAPALPEAADIILHPILEQNQIHAGGLLFHKFLGMPIIKRDVVFRELYSVDEVLSGLSSLTPQALSEVKTDLLRRGSAASLGIWDRLLYRHGAL